MNPSGTYVVTGGFDKTVPGDKLEGLLLLRQDEDGSVPPFGLITLSAILGRKPVTSAPYAVNDLRISRAGAISFTIRSDKLGTVWSFTGFFSGGAITGRHGLAFTSPKRPRIQGPWTGTRLPDPATQSDAFEQAAFTLIATPEARAQMAAFMDKFFQPKQKQDDT